MLTTCMLVLLTAAESPWITINPTHTAGQAAVILPATTIQPGHSYVLAWSMLVEGEKTWRFRADFAGVTLQFNDQKSAYQTSCWKTLDWQRAWIVFNAPQASTSIEASMAIVSSVPLPGRFRVRDVRLIDLAQPLALDPASGELRIAVQDHTGNATPARVYVLDEKGRGHTPDFSFAYTQGTRCFELTQPELARLALPAGRYTVRAMKGFEHAIAESTVEVKAGERHHATLTLQRRFNWNAKGWHSTDHHTHLFRHGGSLYPMMNLNDVHAIAQAEGLDTLPFQGVDRALESDSDYRAPYTATSTQELTRDFWGHICPVGFRGNPEVEEFGSAAPMNADYIEAIVDAKGAVAYAHPYGPLRKDNEFAALADPKAGLIAREWPIDVALGIPCTIDILAKEDANGQFALKTRDYMRLLDLGFRCGVSGSTDFHLDQAREPIGGLRTYFYGDASPYAVANAYNKGRTFATNGPLVDLKFGGLGVGSTLALDSPRNVKGHVDAASLWGIDRVRLVMNGRSVKKLLAKDGEVKSSDSGAFSIDVDRSGWLLAVVEGPNVPEVMTSPEGKPCVPGQYAITSPIYIAVKDKPIPPDPEAAEYFMEWVNAVLQGFNTLCDEQAKNGAPIPNDQRGLTLMRLHEAHQRFFEATGISPDVFQKEPKLILSQ